MLALSRNDAKESWQSVPNPDRQMNAYLLLKFILILQLLYRSIHNIY